MIWYHGSNRTIDKFNTDFVGTGNDQYGPGIYFSNSKKFSSNYGEYLYEADIIKARIRNGLTRISPDIRTTAVWAKGSPTWRDTAANWDEDERVGLRKAAESICSEATNLSEYLQCLWAEFYMKEEKFFCARMSEKLIDGYTLKIDKSSDLEFLILFNPEAIRRFSITKKQG